MARTISGHVAYEPGSDELATGVIPGTKIRLTAYKPLLPILLNVGKRLHKRVHPLSATDTWSYAYRPPRMGTGWSDHAGHAADFWASTIGANTGTGPTRMTAAQARAMSEVLEEYRVHGEYILGWGTRRSNPGVTYGGPTYANTSDPMHVFRAPGVTVEELREVRQKLGIDEFGNRR